MAAPKGPFGLDDAFAHALLGKRLLVGLTFVDASGKPEAQVQFYGVVEIADTNGVGVRVQGETRRGELVPLPPDRRAFRAADPGEYRLRSTGEVMIDPDFTATWTVERPPSHEAATAS